MRPRPVIPPRKETSAGMSSLTGPADIFFPIFAGFPVNFPGILDVQHALEKLRAAGAAQDQKDDLPLDMARPRKGRGNRRRPRPPRLSLLPQAGNPQSAPPDPRSGPAKRRQIRDFRPVPARLQGERPDQPAQTIQPVLFFPHRPNTSFPSASISVSRTSSSRNRAVLGLHSPKNSGRIHQGASTHQAIFSASASSRRPKGYHRA